jgi:hypothetical protein
LKSGLAVAAALLSRDDARSAAPAPVLAAAA